MILEKLLRRLFTLTLQLSGKFGGNFLKLLYLDSGSRIGFGLSLSCDQEVSIIAEAVNRKKLLGTAMYDVGANIGSYTLALRKYFPENRIYSYEPSQKSFELLVKNCGSDHLIELNQIAISDYDGIGYIFSETPMQADPSATLLRTSSGTEEKCTVRTLTTIIYNHGGEVPSFIKIDVEGKDLDVLIGLGLSLAHVPIIQFEISPASLGIVRLIEYWNIFKDSHVLFRLTMTSLLEINSYTFSDENFLGCNYVAIKEDYLAVKSCKTQAS